MRRYRPLLHNPLLLIAITMIATAASTNEVALPSETIAPPDLAGSIELRTDLDVQDSQAEEIWTGRPNRSIDGGYSDRMVRNVSRAALIPVLPDPAKATKTAVIVAPGGGFYTLAIDGEGFDIAQFLADHGVAAFVLKYRVTETPSDEDEYQAYKQYLRTEEGQIRREAARQAATQDALRAIDTIRTKAKQWNVNPDRVGILGFSAGAGIALGAVQDSEESEQPAFLGYIYGRMTAIEIPDYAPPMFAAIALDDEVFAVRDLGIMESWKKANSPIELHAYERGGHAFGLGTPGTTTTLMMGQFLAWLQMHGMLDDKYGGLGPN